MRTEIGFSELDDRDAYRLLTSVVVPRPIAWVSSTSAEGVDNLAPHSFFNVSCAEPPIVQFSSTGHKDTLRNVQETRAFVVNLSPSEMFEEINATATDFPAGVSEFDAVGVRREPSRLVRPPRVADSPVALECELHSATLFGGSTVVFGRVVQAAVNEDVLVEGRPDVELLRPLARLGRNQWSELGELREITRISYADWPGHYRNGD